MNMTAIVVPVVPKAPITAPVILARNPGLAGESRVIPSSEGEV